MCLLEQNGGVYVCRISKYNIRMNQEKQKAKKSNSFFAGNPIEAELLLSSCFD